MKTKLEQARKAYHDAHENLNKVRQRMDQTTFMEKLVSSTQKDMAALNAYSEELAKARVALYENELRYFTLEAMYEAQVNGDSEAVRKCAAEHEAFCKADQAVQEAWAEMWAAWKEGGGLLDSPSEKYPAAEKKYITAHDAWREAQKQYVAAWRKAKEE